MAGKHNYTGEALQLGPPIDDCAGYALNEGVLTHGRGGRSTSIRRVWLHASGYGKYVVAHTDTHTLIFRRKSQDNKDPTVIGYVLAAVGRIPHQHVSDVLTPAVADVTFCEIEARMQEALTLHAALTTGQEDEEPDKNYPETEVHAGGQWLALKAHLVMAHGEDSGPSRIIKFGCHLSSDQALIIPNFLCPWLTGSDVSNVLPSGRKRSNIKKPMGPLHHTFAWIPAGGLGCSLHSWSDATPGRLAELYVYSAVCGESLGSVLHARTRETRGLVHDLEIGSVTNPFDDTTLPPQIFRAIVDGDFRSVIPGFDDAFDCPMTICNLGPPDAQLVISCDQGDKAGYTVGGGMEARRCYRKAISFVQAGKPIPVQILCHFDAEKNMYASYDISEQPAGLCPPAHGTPLRVRPRPAYGAQMDAPPPVASSGRPTEYERLVHRLKAPHGYPARIYWESAYHRLTKTGSHLSCPFCPKNSALNGIQQWYEHCGFKEGCGVVHPTIALKKHVTQVLLFLKGGGSLADKLGGPEQVVVGTPGASCLVSPPMEREEAVDTHLQNTQNRPIVLEDPLTPGVAYTGPPSERGGWPAFDQTWFTPSHLGAHCDNQFEAEVAWPAQVGWDWWTQHKEWSDLPPRGWLWTQSRQHGAWTWTHQKQWAHTPAMVATWDTQRRAQ